MAQQINDGGAAFPIPNDDRPGAYPAEPGMSLRDYFAAQVIGHLSALNDGVRIVDCANAAYQIADAMLAARKVTE